MVDYATLKIPSELRKKFDALNKKHKLGYTSFAEFVKEAVRQRFEEIINTYERPKD